MSQGWQVFDVNAAKNRQDDSKNVQFSEIFHTESMQCGLYHLKKGSTDMQTPHDEDEMYYVLEGKASLRLGDQVTEVTPGTLLYVSASTEHSFFEIEEDMTLLVLFA